MHQSVKLTDAIWFLHLAIFSAFIHALGDPNQDPTGIRTWEADDLQTELSFTPYLSLLRLEACWWAVSTQFL